MREGVPYRIVGGVRFYERKEIKDTLAYLKLLLNQGDDVSFRRVVNTPPRGIGKMVLDALQAAGPAAAPDGAPPLVAAGLHDGAAGRSMWARTQHVVAERRLPPRALGALRGFRDLVTELAGLARSEGASLVIEQVLERSAYMATLEEERSEDAKGRIENLKELVSAAAVPAGGSRQPPSEKVVAERLQFIKMKGNETFKVAVRSLEEIARETLAANQLTIDALDLYVPHQANMRILNAVSDRLGLPKEKIMLNLDRYGNTSAASIPIALDEAVRAGRVKDGSLVMLGAFGAGLTWASALIGW